MSISRKRILLYILLIESLVLFSMNYTLLPEPPYLWPENLERPGGVSLASRTLSVYSFISDASLKTWEEKVFKGRTAYRVESDEKGGAMVVAESDGTSSALYKQTNVDTNLRPQLIWEWKVDRFPSKLKHDDLGDKNENDFAARVYAVFPGSTIFGSDVIQYVWDERFPVGQSAQSAFSNNVKILVIESGPSEGTDWVLERRDIYKDYEMLYGKPPEKKLGAIAFMGDSDNTRTKTRAYFKYFQIEIPKEIEQS